MASEKEEAQEMQLLLSLYIHKHLYSMLSLKHKSLMHSTLCDSMWPLERV